MLFSRSGKEPLGGCNVTPFAQEKVDGAARFIHGAIEVDPLAFDLEVSLIHAPRVAGLAVRTGSSAFQTRGHTAAPTEE